jgi:ribosomal protein L12E/L44/L45/RPP1/RPP2
VKVRFAQASSRIEFTAQMVNGVVQTSVTNETAPAVAPPKPQAPRYEDDDDDHEERDDDREEHEDDEEHERDDD